MSTINEETKTILISFFLYINIIVNVSSILHVFIKAIDYIYIERERKKKTQTASN